MTKNPFIKEVDLDADTSSFKKFHVGCIVLAENNQILLQQRPQNWHTFPGCLATFGGEIEAGETPLQALVRELREELGATIIPEEVVSLGAITEKIANYKDLIYVYFWHDKNGTIKGCYDGGARYYKTCEEAQKHPKIMQDVRWLLDKCKKLKLLDC